MRTSIFAYSKRGIERAEALKEILGEECLIYTTERLAEPGLLVADEDTYGREFAASQALVFISSCGIAVRKIAPFIVSKVTDPAVICMDELGKNVIPLLSGHIGGANSLAIKIAEALGSNAVITTATDINGKFSPDAWASKEGYVIENTNMIKNVSAAILDKGAGLACEYPVTTSLPAGLTYGDQGENGIYIGYRDVEPFENTLYLTPKTIKIGIGCRRGTPEERIEAAVDMVLKENGIRPAAVRMAASIDLKADEEGLKAFCTKKGWPIEFYSSEELLSVEGDFKASEFVKSITGVDNVCERAAALGCERVIVNKTAMDGVTVAVACYPWEVRFE